jgi:hypothetical protein
VVEHFLGKEEVTGSIPVVGTKDLIFKIFHKNSALESIHVKGKI